MDKLTSAIITVNLLPSNYSLRTDEEKAIDRVVKAAVDYNAQGRAEPEYKLLTSNEEMRNV